jgi:hypothetical protein
MNKDEFNEKAEELFGNSWQTRLARAIGVDPSSVRRWVSGAVAVPEPVTAYLSMMIERQKLRGKLAFLNQDPECPVGFNGLCENREKFDKLIQFPGVDQKKAMPSIHALEIGHGIDLRLGSETEDDLVPGFTYLLTRHPDCFQLEAYESAAVSAGFDILKTKVRYHHYSVILQETPSLTAVQYQIITHGGEIRTVINTIESGHKQSIASLTKII